MLIKTAVMAAAMIILTSVCGCGPEDPESRLENMGIAFEKEEFFRQAEEGNIEAVKLFLDGGFDVDARNPTGKTALMAASRLGHPELVEFLLERGADTGAADMFDNTALMMASWHGRKEALDILIEAGADLNAASSAGITPLMWAAETEGGKIAKTLIERGADIEKTSRDGWDALKWAALRENLQNIDILIENGADVNRKNPENGRTPLMEAASAGKARAATALIEHGAGLDTKDTEGYSALTYAVALNNPRITDILLAEGADPNIRGLDGTPVLLVAQSEIFIMPRVIRSLIEAGADICPEREVDRPAFRAAAGGELRQMEDPEEGKPDVEAVDEAGWSLLMWAVVGGCPETARFLLRSGADPDHENDHGLTPLLTAIMDDNIEMIDVMAAGGADLEKETPGRLTPFIKAVYASGISTLEHLIETGADINARTPGGMTPLMFSVLTGDGRRVKLLLEKGADPGAAEDSRGLTARQLALELGLEEIAEIIEEYEDEPGAAGFI